MPRNKKKKQGNGGKAPGKHAKRPKHPARAPPVPRPKGSGKVVDEETRQQYLTYLQEMFDKKLDPVVVHMIMEDCNYNVDTALETLFSLAGDVPGADGSGVDLDMQRARDLVSYSYSEESDSESEEEEEDESDHDLQGASYLSNTSDSNAFNKPGGVGLDDISIPPFNKKPPSRTSNGGLDDIGGQVPPFDKTTVSRTSMDDVSDPPVIKGLDTAIKLANKLDRNAFSEESVQQVTAGLVAYKHTGDENDLKQLGNLSAIAEMLLEMGVKEEEKELEEEAKPVRVKRKTVHSRLPVYSVTDDKLVGVLTSSSSSENSSQSESDDVDDTVNSRGTTPSVSGAPAAVNFAARSRFGQDVAPMESHKESERRSPNNADISLNGSNRMNNGDVDKRKIADEVSNNKVLRTSGPAENSSKENRNKATLTVRPKGSRVWNDLKARENADEKEEEEEEDKDEEKSINFKEDEADCAVDDSKQKMNHGSSTGMTRNFIQNVRSSNKDGSQNVYPEFKVQKGAVADKQPLPMQNNSFTQNSNAQDKLNIHPNVQPTSTSGSRNPFAVSNSPLDVSSSKDKGNQEPAFPDGVRDFVPGFGFSVGNLQGRNITPGLLPRTSPSNNFFKQFFQKDNAPGDVTTVRPRPPWGPPGYGHSTFVNPLTNDPLFTDLFSIPPPPINPTNPQGILTVPEMHLPLIRPTYTEQESASQRQWPLVRQTNYKRTEYPTPTPKPTEPLPQGKVLCLMRGCPGSGKSYLAKNLKGDGVILSSDDYYMVNGEYQFDVDLVGEAHDWNKTRADDHLKKGTSPIIIDNTNLMRWEMKPYVAMALKHQYQVVFREADTPWKYKIGELAKRNSHGVPRGSIARMLDRFEHNVTIESVMKAPDKKKTTEYVAKVDGEEVDEGETANGNRDAPLDKDAANGDRDGDVAKSSETSESSEPGWEVAGKKKDHDHRQRGQHSGQSRGQPRGGGGGRRNMKQENGHQGGSPRRTNNSQPGRHTQRGGPVARIEKEKSNSPLRGIGSPTRSPNRRGGQRRDAPEHFNDSEDGGRWMTSSPKRGRRNGGPSSQGQGLEQRKNNRRRENRQQRSPQKTGVSGSMDEAVQFLQELDASVPNPAAKLEYEVNTMNTETELNKSNDSWRDDDSWEADRSQSSRSKGQLLQRPQGQRREKTINKINSSETNSFLSTEGQLENSSSFERKESYLGDSTGTTDFSVYPRSDLSMSDSSRNDDWNTGEQQKRTLKDDVKRESDSSGPGARRKVGRSNSMSKTPRKMAAVFSPPSAKNEKRKTTPDAHNTDARPSTVKSANNDIEASALESINNDTRTSESESAKNDTKSSESGKIDSKTVNNERETCVSDPVIKEPTVNDLVSANNETDASASESITTDTRTSPLESFINNTDANVSEFDKFDNRTSASDIDKSVDGEGFQESTSKETSASVLDSSNARTSASELASNDHGGSASELDWSRHDPSRSIPKPTFPLIGESQEHCVDVKEMHTMTDPQDLSILQRIAAGTMDVSDLPQGYIFRSFPAPLNGDKWGQIRQKGCMTEEKAPSRGASPVPVSVKLHKGCMTEEVDVASTPEDEKLSMMQFCFPDASEENLRHMLETCGGDVEWATNLLLDSMASAYPNQQDEGEIQTLEHSAGGNSMDLDNNTVGGIDSGHPLPGVSSIEPESEQKISGPVLDKDVLHGQETAKQPAVGIVSPFQNDPQEPSGTVSGAINTLDTGSKKSLAEETIDIMVDESQRFASELEHASQIVFSDSQERATDLAKDPPVEGHHGIHAREQSNKLSEGLPIQTANFEQEVETIGGTPTTDEYVSKSKYDSIESDYPEFPEFSNDFTSGITETLVKGSKKESTDCTIYEGLPSLLSFDVDKQFVELAKALEKKDSSDTSLANGTVVSEEDIQSKSSGTTQLVPPVVQVLSSGAGSNVENNMKEDVSSARKTSMTQEETDIPSALKSGEQDFTYDQLEDDDAASDVESEGSTEDTMAQIPPLPTDSATSENISQGDQHVVDSEVTSVNGNVPQDSQRTNIVETNTQDVGSPLLGDELQASSCAGNLKDDVPGPKSREGESAIHDDATSEESVHSKPKESPPVTEVEGSQESLIQAEITSSLASSQEEMTSEREMPDSDIPWKSEFLEIESQGPTEAKDPQGDNVEDGGARIYDYLGGMELQMDPAFALQLQELFGPVGFHLQADALASEDLKVKIGYQLARDLHRAWSSGLQERFQSQERQVDDMLQRDAELARRLQQEENLKKLAKSHRDNKKPAKFVAPGSPRRSKKQQRENESPTSSSRSSPKPAKRSAVLVGGAGLRQLDELGAVGGGEDGEGRMGPPGVQRMDVPDLAQIMAEEEIIQRKDEQEIGSYASPLRANTIATKLKRDQLHEAFPDVDRSVLNDIFMANNYDLQQTMWEVTAVYGESMDPSKNVFSDEAFTTVQGKRISSPPRKGTDDEWCDSADGHYQSTEQPEYEDYRAEATLHYKQRDECFKKAAKAYHAGQKELALHYSNQGHLHSVKLKEANRRAAERIIDQRRKETGDNKLDLHNLHVEEALQALQETLITKEQEPWEGRRYIEVVTGKGKHSRGRVAKLKPAVERFLQQKGYRFHHLNEGSIRVYLS